jgi:hypothetical protein
MTGRLLTRVACAQSSMMNTREPGALPGPAAIEKGCGEPGASGRSAGALRTPSKQRQSFKPQTAPLPWLLPCVIEIRSKMSYYETNWRIRAWNDDFL